MYGALTCGACKACREGRDNLCENVGGIMGFHVDGFARDLVNMPERLVIKVPAGSPMREAACAPIAFATVEHMLFDNAQARSRANPFWSMPAVRGSARAAIGWRRRSAAPSSPPSATTPRPRKQGAGRRSRHQLPARRFEHVVRKITAKKGVDVVFEHVGADTFTGSLLSLKRGGRLVTCGATSGPSATFNLMQLFQQQYQIFGSFGASMQQYPHRARQDGAAALRR